MTHRKHIYSISVRQYSAKFEYTGLTEPEANAQFHRDANRWIEDLGIAYTTDDIAIDVRSVPDYRAETDFSEEVASA